MTGFVIWASLCAVAAALFVAVPLLRVRDTDAPQYGLGVAAGILVALSAAVLYTQWGHWSWRTPPAADTAGIEALLAATNDHPEDVQAWLNLGHGYLQIAQWPLARRSFQHADRLSHGSNAAALSGIAESIVYANNGGQSPEAAALFDRALALDPHSPPALFYTAVALLNAGDLQAARARFATLRDLGPPPQVVAALDKQIAAIDTELARSKPDPATRIQLLISLAPALAASVPARGALFVFVRAPRGGPPLAVKRLNPEFPQRVELSATDSMVAGNRIRPGQRVQVVARISASGSPTPSAGDLFGAVTAVAGASAQHDLAIDRHGPE